MARIFGGRRDKVNDSMTSYCTNEKQARRIRGSSRFLACARHAVGYGYGRN